MPNQENTNTNYNAQSITVLEGLDPVRKRPGMYIGGTGIEGLHHLIWEVLDNSIDEAMAGFADKVIVTLMSNNYVSVEDNGRGIPVDLHPQTNKSALETVLTTLHAGGKFGGNGYKVSGGLHGVGVSVVNALSKETIAEVYRDGKVYQQKYLRGIPQSDVKIVGDTEKCGTKITFLADNEIFEVVKYNWNTIIDRCRQQAYLTGKIQIIIIDQREEDKQKKYHFYFEGGVASYIKYLSGSKKLLADPPIYINKNIQDIQVEVSLSYIDDYNEHLYSFANNIITPEGGTHLTGFRSALTKAINDYAKKYNLIKESDSALSGDDVREGLVAIISVKLGNPQFEGQTKAKLGNPEVRAVVDTIANLGIGEYLGEHPQESKRIIEKCYLSARARLAAKAARETVIRKGALEGMTLPGKLADCSEKNASKSELYIVEGDSAGGSAKQGRDRKFQAILPLRGKILNVERARLDRMLSSDEIKALVVAMGAGIGDQIDINKMRYHRIIIMTDADVDGAHIRTLLLTFFFRHFPEIIDQGYVYIAQPPLYSINSGKNKIYAYSDEERDKIIAKLRTSNEKATFTIQRYKGLGEMNPDQLWETTMDPVNRILLRVRTEDAERSSEIFSMLMGEEVLPRKKFIQTHAVNVKNLDI